MHGHSGSVYLVSFRTQKSSLPASLPILWYESPRERKSLCPSLFTSVPRPVLGAIGRFPSLGTGLFCVLDTINTFNERHSGGNEHMPINTVDIFGSDQVGIHLAAVGNVLFHPPELPQPSLDILEQSIELELVPTMIGGSNLVGALLCGNSRGMAVADIATERDIDALTSYGDVVVMEGGVNTAGNLMVVNEAGAVASPAIPRDGLEILSDVLGVPIVSTTVAGQDVVGSLAAANDKGVLLHPDVTPDEALVIEEILGVPPMVGTVSFGSPYVGAGVCASNTGAVSGTKTTGPELNRVEDALGFL